MARLDRRMGRWFRYDRRVLPNSYLASLDPEEPSPELARLSAIEPDDDDARRVLQKEWNVEFIRWLGESEKSSGYPTWNLLYYALFTSLLPDADDLVVVETGTN